MNTGLTGTLQSNCSSVWYFAGVLTADGVVPQRGCSDARWNIRQTDNEIGRSEAL